MAYQTATFQRWRRYIVKLINDHNQDKNIWTEYGSILKTRPYDYYIAYNYLHNKYHIWASTEDITHQTIHLLALEVLARLVDYNIHCKLENQTDLEHYYQTINNYYNYNIKTWIYIILSDLDYWLWVFQTYATRREFIDYLYFSDPVHPNDSHQLYINDTVIWAERIIYMEYLGLSTLSPLRKNIIVNYNCSHICYYTNYLLESIFIPSDQGQKLFDNLSAKFSNWLEGLPYNEKYKFKIGQELYDKVYKLRLYTALHILISWRNNSCLETIFVTAKQRKLSVIYDLVQKLSVSHEKISKELLPLQQCKALLYATDSDLKCLVSN